MDLTMYGLITLLILTTILIPVYLRTRESKKCKRTKGEE